MKIGFIFLLPLLLAQLASGQVASNSVPPSPLLAKLDAQYGFGEMKFEQSIDSCKGLTLLEDDDRIKFYDRTGDNLELGGAKLKSVEYGFYKGKLATIMITSEPAPNGDLLLQALVKEFGPTTKSPHNPNKQYWFGQKVTGDYLVNATGQASVGLWSKPMQAARGADEKAAQH